MFKFRVLGVLGFRVFRIFFSSESILLKGFLQAFDFCEDCVCFKMGFASFWGLAPW